MSMDCIQITNDPVINAADLGADQTSSSVNLKNAVGYAAQIYWSGGTLTAGNIITEGTNDNADDSGVTPIWTQISSDAVATTSGSLMKNPGTRADFSFLRVRWDQSAGTGGTITCKVSVKR